jgi:hypothetical protein
MRYLDKARTSKGKVTIAKGFKLWREVVIEVSDYHGMGMDVTVSWSDELRQLVVSRIDIRQPEGGAPITAEALRQIAMQQFVRHSVIASVRDGLTPMGGEDNQERMAFGLIPREQVEQCQAAGPVPETLKWVALLYRGALAMGDAPTKKIRDVFDISQSTAGAWVAAARKQGHLGESEGPGKARG